jgi:hypothetical protein
MSETSPIAPNSVRPARRRAKTAAEAKPQVNADESPLAWLARRKDKDGRPMISELEFNAGEKLRADFFFAAMTPQVTSNWQRFLSADSRKTSFGVAGADLSDNIIAARERVRLALKAVGPELSGILIDVCCHLLRLEVAEKSGGWPQRSGKVVLSIALRHLARHYGMSDSAGGHEPRGAVRIRHWGSDDYKPRIEAEQG